MFWVVELNPLPFVRSITKNEERNCPYLAVHTGSCGERCLRGRGGTDFFPDAMENGGPISVHGGAGAAGEPIWSDGQRSWIVARGGDFRVLFVPTDIFAAG